MNVLSVMMKRLDRGLESPKYARPGDSGMDVRAARTTWFWPFSVKYVPVGIAVAMPTGLELQVRPRSGMTRAGWIIPTGTVDSGYRGEIGVVLFNARLWPRRLKRGERIAQIVFARVQTVKWDTIAYEDDLPKSLRGDAGWGSTGTG